MNENDEYIMEAQDVYNLTKSNELDNEQLQEQQFYKAQIFKSNSQEEEKEEDKEEDDEESSQSSSSSSEEKNEEEEKKETKKKRYDEDQDTDDDGGEDVDFEDIMFYINDPEKQNELYKEVNRSSSLSTDIEMTDRPIDNKKSNSKNQSNHQFNKYQYHPEITDSTETGRIINQYLQKWDQKISDLKENGKKNKIQPLLRGNCFCFLYIDAINMNEPMLTLGPDFKFTFIELILFNAIIFFTTNWGSMQNVYQKIVLSFIILQNITFLSTVLLNPGMLDRNPRIHGMDYLKKIAEEDNMHAICRNCKVIKPQNVKNISHCSWCDVCVKGHDHHCVWSSKCIASRNIYCFYLFISMTCACFVMFWINMVLFIAQGNMKITK